MKSNAKHKNDLLVKLNNAEEVWCSFERLSPFQEGVVMLLLKFDIVHSVASMRETTTSIDIKNQSHRLGIKVQQRQRHSLLTLRGCV